jgi:putative ABC transport system substrate-binding protein
LGRQVLVALVALVAAMPAFPQRVDRPLRIATLDEARQVDRPRMWALFHKRMAELGHIQGSSYIVDSRWGNADPGALPALAADLVALKPDVIVAAGTPSALAAKRATSRIPLVFVGVAEPVKAGLVSSLARPEGNVTGVTNIGTQIAGKWLALIREMAPTAKSLAFLTAMGNPGSMLIFRELQEQARPFGVAVTAMDGSSPESVNRAFETMAQERVDALIMSAAGPLHGQRRQIVDAAARLRIPAIFAVPDFSEAGGLVSFSADPRPLWMRAADLVDRILKGAKPAEIPVEQAATFKLVVNLRTARTLGLKIPQSVVIRADKVIE